MYYFPYISNTFSISTFKLIDSRIYTSLFRIQMPANLLQFIHFLHSSRPFGRSPTESPSYHSHRNSYKVPGKCSNNVCTLPCPLSATSSFASPVESPSPSPSPSPGVQHSTPSVASTEPCDCCASTMQSTCKFFMLVVCFLCVRASHIECDRKIMSTH